jgi:hypothetical protein
MGAAAVLVVLAAAGCSASPALTPTPTPSATPPQSAIAPTGAGAAPQAPAGPRAPVPHGAAPVATPSAAAPAKPRASFGEGMVSRYRVEIPVDNGPEPHAMGTVTTDAHGVPASYRAAPDDLTDFIAERFGFFERQDDPSYNSGINYLNTINQVRRGGYPWTLYAGDTLNLSAFTITSVGDQDGVVKHEPAPDPMPPQH